MKDVVKAIVGFAAMIVLIAFGASAIGLPMWLNWILGALAYAAVILWSDITEEAGSIFEKIELLIGFGLFVLLIGGLELLIVWLANKFGGNLVFGVVGGVLVVGWVLMLVAVKRMKKNKQIYEERKAIYEERKAKVLSDAETDEQIQQELALVKGNWLKKEMIAKKLKRQYFEQKMKDTPVPNKVNSKWNDFLNFGKVFFVNIPLGLIGFPLVVWVFMVVIFWGLESVDVKWLVYVNVMLAFVAALVLTLRRHGYQAFIMWLAFGMFTSGVLLYGTDLIPSLSTMVLCKYEPIPFAYYSAGLVGVSMRTGFILLSLTSLCFALYSWLKRWTIPLWCALALAICVFADVNAECDGFSLYNVCCAFICIVGMCLDVPYWLAFLLCNFYFWALLMVYCTVPAAVEGCRIATLPARQRFKPAVVGIVWLLLHVILVAAVCYVLFYGYDLEGSARVLRKIIVIPGDVDETGLLIPSYSYFHTIVIVADLFVNWLIYRYVKSKAKTVQAIIAKKQKQEVK